MITVCLVLFALLFIEKKIIVSQKKYAHLINASGYQRMLSKKITLLVYELNTEKSPSEIDRLQNLLDESRESFFRFQSVNKANQLNLSEYTNQFSSHIDQALQDSSKLSALSNYVESTLLPKLNDVVLTYEQKSNEINQFQQNYLVFIFLIITLLIITDSMFVFSPLLKLYKKSYKELKEQHLHTLQSKEMYTQILNSIPDPIFVKNTNHQWILMNSEFAKLIGHQPEALYGKTDYDFFPPEMAAIYYQKDDEALNAATPIENLESLLDHEGRTRKILTKKSKCIDAAGNTILVGVIRDVTEQSKIEEELKNQHQFIQKITDSIPSIIYVRNIKDDSIVYVNNRLSDVLGYSREELYAHNTQILRDLCHPEDLNLIKSTREKLISLNDHQTIDIEFRIKHKNGHWMWCRDHGAIFERDKSGQPVLSLGFIQDISEKKEALEKLESEKIKAAHASKMATLGEMAGGIAHEINNPLTVILGLTKLLQRHSREEITDQHPPERYLEKIENMTNRISRIVKSLSNFSRNADKDPMRETFLSKIVDETLELCLEKFRTQQIHIEVDVDKNLAIFCREVQISQVLLNLLNNSYDAIQNNAEKWIKIQATEKFDEIELSITDSGTGIQKEIGEKIMNPFFTTKEQGKGTGLGLSISKGIIEEHDGRLELNSESSHTQFIIHFPRYNPISLSGKKASTKVISGLNPDA